MFLDKEKILRFYIDYIKSTLFYVAFNGWISVITIEIFVFFSGYCGVKPLLFDDFFQYGVLVPLLIIATFEIIYGFIFIVIVSGKVPKYKINIDEDIRKKGNDKAQQIFLKNYKKLSKNVCLMGATLYGVAGFISSEIIILSQNIEIYDSWRFRIIVTILASFFGIMWNTVGYHRVHRIDWSEIFKGFDKKKIKKHSLQSLIHETVYQVIAILAILILFFSGIYCCNTNNAIAEEGITYFNIVFVVYFTLISMFIRYFIKAVNPKKATILYPKVFNSLYIQNSPQIKCEYVTNRYFVGQDEDKIFF